MSVINDMLRDLESRKAAASDGTVSADQVQSMIEQESRSPWLIGAGIAVLLAIAISLFFVLSDDPKEVSVAEIAVQAMPSDEASQAEGEPEEPKVASAEPIQKAEVNSKTDKRPVQTEASKSLVNKTAAVKNGSSTVSKPASSTTKASKAKAEAQKTTVSKSSVVKSKPVVAKAASKKPALQTRAKQAQSKQTAPAKTISAKALDSQNAKAAQSLFQKGNDQDAYTLLNTFIAEREQTLQSRSVLLTYLMRDQRIDEAGEVLATLPVDADPALRQIKARWLVAKGETEEALFTLHSQLPGIVDYPDYYALLASYYQQFGYADKAVALYTELVQLDNESANWWAGLAVALDSIGQSNEARIAYNQAARLPGLRPELMGFVAQRAEQLSR